MYLMPTQIQQKNVVVMLNAYAKQKHVQNAHHNITVQVEIIFNAKNAQIMSSKRPLV
jgi:hypothetical protein